MAWIQVTQDVSLHGPNQQFCRVIDPIADLVDRQLIRLFVGTRAGGLLRIAHCRELLENIITVRSRLSLLFFV